MTTTAERVLARHVEALNSGVAGNGFDRLGDGLTDTCTMRFEGIPVGPFEGRDAVVEAYRTSPPDDGIVVLEAEYGERQVVATYAWAAAPQRPAGRMLLDLDGELISALTIEYWSD
jgi:hypothetical protein